MSGEFEQYPPARWSVRGYTVVFPVDGVTETGANRIVEREKPYRDGAKLDDTGSKARRWNLTCCFENSIEGAGLEENGIALYPDTLNLLLESFRVHETGDLVVPTVGRVRARADTYQRDERNSDRDGAALVLTFIEDNEDYFNRNSVKPTNVRGVANRLADATVFSQESISNQHLTIGQLQEAVSNLEGLVNSPFDYAQQIEWTAGRVVQLVEQVTRIFSIPGRRGRDTLRGPGGNDTNRKLQRHKEVAAAAQNDSRRGRPILVWRTAERDTSIFDIAVEVQQLVQDLLAINPQLSNPLFVPKGSRYRVLEADGNVGNEGSQVVTLAGPAP